MKDIRLVSFGETLKTYRKQQGFTQQQLAMKLGVHHNTIGAWERGDYLPETRGIVLELAVYLRLNDGEIQQLFDASLTTISSHWSLPHQRNPFFIDREEVLQCMHLILSGKYNVSSSRSCALRGLSGIGKTQTAIEYAYRHCLQYSAIFWIDADGQESVIRSFVAIANALNLSVKHVQEPEDVVALVLNWLNSHHDWLLICDNVEDIERIKRFLPSPREGSLLFTTRLPTLGTLAPCIDLEPLSLERSGQLLLHRSGLQSLSASKLSLTGEEEATVRAIVGAIDGLPLALDQAGAYIGESHCSLSTFLYLLQTSSMQILQERPASMVSPLSVVETFSFAFERLRQQNGIAAELLLWCCFCAPDEIPEALLMEGLALLDPDLQRAMAHPLLLNTLFKDLSASALLGRNARTQMLNVHRLVQAVLREKLAETEQRKWIECVIGVINYVFLIEHDQLNVERWPFYERILPHAQFALQQAAYKNLVSPEADSLSQKTAIYLWQRAQYQQVHLSEGDDRLEHAPELICQQPRGQKETSVFSTSPKQLSTSQVALQDLRVSAGNRLAPAPSRADEQESDPFETFVQECCETSAYVYCRTADLWRAYQRWTRDYGNGSVLSRQAFAFKLKAKGYAPSRTNAHRLWHGIKLKSGN